MSKDVARRGRAHRWRTLVVAVAALGLLGALTAAPASAYTSPAIWVGSPVKGTWGVKGDGSTVPAGGHHRLHKASPANDWSVDLSSIPNDDRGVYLYVAPSNSTYNNKVTTKVLQIVDDQACRYGGGGDLVTIGVYYNGTLYGRVTYAHIDRVSTLKVGQTVGRWGTKLGNASNLTPKTSGGSGCWTGRHVHFEMRAETQYSCWNKGYKTGQGLSRTNFVGFISGPLKTSARACP